MTEIKRFNPESLQLVYGRYSNVASVKAGELIMVAGQCGVHQDGMIPEGFAEQCQLTYENIRLALEACGADWSNVVQFTTYLTRSEDIPLFNEFREREYPKMFPNGDYPCNTLLIVSRLVTDTLLFEVQTLAAR